MAANMGVARQTVDNWARDYPEFLDAITVAMVHAQAWWEDLGQNNVISVTGQSLNSGVYTKSMAARFPEDWREKTSTELTGNLRVVSATDLKDDELAAIATSSGV